MNRRMSTLIILGAVLLGALAIDRGLDDDVATVAATIDNTQFPIASAPDALSSTWYCAGGTGEGDEPFANHIVDILNPTEERLQVTLTVFGGEIAPPPPILEDEDGDDGEESDDEEAEATTTTVAEAQDPPEPVTQSFELASRTRQQVVLADLVQAPIVSALIEADGGGLVVEHEVVSQHGRDAKPCSTSAGTTWHFAWGNTTVDARELLVLFNPFPDDAIVEGVFSTEAGIREPQRFGGLVVPGRGTIAVDLGDDVARRSEVAATITARSGRVVVDRILRLNGSAGRGLTVQTGVPEPQQQWVFPYGYVGENVSEQFVVYNPTDVLAEVEIVTELADPDTNGGVEPLQLSVPPGTHVTTNPAADERIPGGVAHRSVVRSANGVPVVAERVQYAATESRRGISVTTGSPVEATTWFFAAGSAGEANDQWLNIVNLDTQVLAEVSVKAFAQGQLVDVSELQDVELPAGGRLDIRLGEHIPRDDLSIVVVSTEPIVVERAMYRTADRGVSNTVGVPGPDGLRLPVNPFDVEGDLDVDLGDLEDAPTLEDDPNAPPTAPDDVDLPEPDETIVIEDPDAEADIPEKTTTTEATTTTEPDADDDSG